MEWLSHVARETKLSPFSVNVAIILANSFSLKNGVCNPSKKYISEELGKSERSVQRALQDLKAAGLVEVKDGSTGRGNTLNYVLKKGDKFVTKAQTKGDKPDSHNQVKGDKNEHKGRQNQAQRETKPDMTYKEGNSIKQEETVPPVVPHGVDQVAWCDLDTYRSKSKSKKIRDGWTNLAKQKAASLLSRLAPQEQRRCVDMTIANSWQGIFPERAKGGGNRQQGDTSSWMDDVKAGKSIFGHAGEVIEGEYEKH